MTKMTLGLENGIVKIVPYSEQWQQLYNEEESRLCAVMGNFIKDIEHIGSTSIFELDAKPIIDIMIGLETLNEVDKCIELLLELGYEYRGENGIPERHFLVKTRNKFTTHHLHMVKWQSEFWKNHLLFRDFLRQNREIAMEYSNLKWKLAKKYENDRDAYTDGKADFIQRILQGAENKEG